MRPSVAQADLSGGVDGVVAHSPEVGVFGGGGGGFGDEVVGVGRGFAVDAAVGAFVVVVVTEVVQDVLQLAQGRALLGAEVFGQGLPEAFDLALGGGFEGFAVFLGDAVQGQEGLARRSRCPRAAPCRRRRIGWCRPWALSVKVAAG